MKGINLFRRISSVNLNLKSSQQALYQLAMIAWLCAIKKIRTLIGRLAVKGCHEVQWVFSQILFNVIILNWRNLIVEFLHLLWDYIYCCYMMVLR